MTNQAQYSKGQRVITPDGEGEIIKVIGQDITVKLDNGENQTYHWDDVQDNGNAG